MKHFYMHFDESGVPDSVFGPLINDFSISQNEEEKDTLNTIDSAKATCFYMSPLEGISAMITFEIAYMHGGKHVDTFYSGNEIKEINMAVIKSVNLFNEGSAKLKAVYYLLNVKDNHVIAKDSASVSILIQ